MLRHPDAASSIDDFTQPRFLPVVPDREVQDAKRILIVSGKLGHELRAERAAAKTPAPRLFSSISYIRCCVRKLLQPSMSILTRVKWCGSRRTKKHGRALLRYARIGQLVQSKG